MPVDGSEIHQELPQRGLSERGDLGLVSYRQDDRPLRGIGKSVDGISGPKGVKAIATYVDERRMFTRDDGNRGHKFMPP
ncbi:hypothetical protein C3941_06285 [Kaistia algarum]|nr:hypothetical protein C3941_06285 [Kaistia algarum]